MMASLLDNNPAPDKERTQLLWVAHMNGLKAQAEMAGILPRAKQQPAGLIACGLRAAALFSSAPSSRKKGTSLS